MRVLIVGVEKQDKKEFIENSFRDLVFVDFAEDIFTAEFLSKIYNYDLIIGFINSKNNMKKYYNILSSLNIMAKKRIISNEQKNYSSVYLIIEQLKYSQDLYFKEYCDNKIEDFQKKYQYLSIENLFYSLENWQKQKYKIISELIINTFFRIPMVKKIDYDSEKKLFILTLEIEKENGEKEEKTISFYSNSVKTINIKVLLFFLRHYEEVLDIETILNSIAEDSFAVKEFSIIGAISFIRKIFQNEMKINPVKTYKKNGYQFVLS